MLLHTVCAASPRSLRCALHAEEQNKTFCCSNFGRAHNCVRFVLFTYGSCWWTHAPRTIADYYRFQQTLNIMYMVLWWGFFLCHTHTHTQPVYKSVERFIVFNFGSLMMCVRCCCCVRRKWINNILNENTLSSIPHVKRSPASTIKERVVKFFLE